MEPGKSRFACPELFFIPKDEVIELKGNVDDDSENPERDSRLEISFPCRLVIRLVFVRELIAARLVDADDSCRPANAELDMRAPDVNDPLVGMKHDGLESVGRWWENLSDNTSPPQASVGVAEKDSSLFEDVALD